MKYILGGLSIIIVIYAIIVIIYRMFDNNGLRFKKIHFKTVNESYYPDQKECTKVFSYTLLFRLFIILLSILIFAVFFSNDSTFSISNAIDNWIKWDANNYLRIANGYTFHTENGLYTTLVFFPLYSFFIMIFKIIFNEVIAGLIVSNIASSLASIFIYKLVSMDYGKKVALMSLVIINIFPFAFFFSSMMSESVFLLFSAMTLYYIRKHKWLLAGICGFLCALSRSLGVFIIIPAVVEFIEEYKLIKNIKNVKDNTKIILKNGLYLLLIPLGFGIYLYCNYHVTSDWFYFLKMQSQIWGQVYKPFYLIFETNINAINMYNSSFIACISIPQLIVICFSYCVLFFSVKKHRTIYSVWLLVNIIVNTSMSWPLSVCRYFTCALPLFIFIANYLKNKRYLYIGYIIVNSILYALYFIAYLKGINVF